MENYSVLMTIYKNDNVEYAKLAIDSMLYQTVRTNNFVIVCDGLLTKELDLMLEHYEQENPDIFQIVKLKENVGLGAALRLGVEVCENNFIARMDSDDIARKERCELEMEMFEQDDSLSLVGAYMNEFEQDFNTPIRLKKVPLQQSEIVKYSKRRNPFNHSTVMFRKRDILSIGNYSELRTNQDVELWIRLLNNGFITANIGKPLVDFRFDKNTYKRRKEWKNIKLLILIWKEFEMKGYCSKIDFVIVALTQLVVYVLPENMLRWVYDNLR